MHSLRQQKGFLVTYLLLLPISRTPIILVFCMICHTKFLGIMPEDKEGADNQKDPFALNISWCFGFNKEVGVMNISPNNSKKLILYAAGHTGIIYDFVNNTQTLLQGHTSNITCIAASGNKRWIALGDNGPDNMISIWDTTSGTPIRNIFDVGGVMSLAISNDARYVAMISSLNNEFVIWDWTSENDEPLFRKELDANPQTFLTFNPENSSELASNSLHEVIFYHFDDKNLTVHIPDLPEKDFNKPIGNFSQTAFKPGSTEALAGSKDGSVTVFDNDGLAENGAYKRVLKLVKLIDDPITVVTNFDDLVVVGSKDGAVRFYDSQLRIKNWYGTFDSGCVDSISFACNDKNSSKSDDSIKAIPAESTLTAEPFIVTDFTISTDESIICHVPAKTNQVKKLLQEHDDAVKAIDTHPVSNYIAVGSYCGLLKIWDYIEKAEINSRAFGLGNEITAISFDKVGEFLAVGFYDGTILILDSTTLETIQGGEFSHAKALITQLAFSHDSIFLAATDLDDTTTLIKRTNDSDQEWSYIGRNKAHYKSIVNIIFGIALDSNVPRLLTLGMDRNLVEYDILNSTEDNLIVMSTDKIEQSATPVSCAWYPPINKEHFLLVANSEYKYKLLNATTKRCRKTLLGPTHGSHIQKIVNLAYPEVCAPVQFFTFDLSYVLRVNFVGY